MKEKVILIGSNHAGTAAATFLLKKPELVDVTIYDRNTNISYLGCGSALWIGKQISNSDGLFYSSEQQLRELGANVHLKSEVLDIDYCNKVVKVRLENGDVIEDKFDKLILATGSRPILPRNIEGLDLENVRVAKLFQDAQYMQEKTNDKNIKHVTVVGAGYIGVELAEAFKRVGKEVLLLDRSERILSSHFDKEFSDMMQERLDKHGIVSRLGETVQGFEGVDGKVKKVLTDKGQYETDMVVMCIGFQPNNQLAEGKLILGPNKAIQTDLHQETSVKGVYAIGDCATVYNNALGTYDYIALATNAVRSGVVAALNILGIGVKSNGVQGSSGLCIYGLKMVATGLSKEAAERHGMVVEETSFTATQKPAFMNECGVNPEVRIKIVFEKETRRVVGAQLISEYDMSGVIHMFSLAIQERVTIDNLSLLDIFFMPHFNEPYNYITMASVLATLKAVL